MDNLTHGLVGGLLGQTGLKHKTGLAMPALIIGANLPDVDAACFFWLEGTEHLGFRRGITHGPPAWVLLPLVLTGLLVAFDRWQQRTGRRPNARLPVNAKWLYALSFLACLTHPALDWLNVYGIRLLEPFSQRWFYGDTLFIIDIWLWALLIGSLWLSRRREKRGSNARMPANIGLAIALMYIGLNAAITKADAHAHDHGILADETQQSISAPVPFAFWQRERIAKLYGGLWASSQWQGAKLAQGAPLKKSEAQQCKLPSEEAIEAAGSQVGAFVFWSRALMAEEAADGSIILRDARFYDPRARDRFSIAMPQVRCAALEGSAGPEPDGG